MNLETALNEIVEPAQIELHIVRRCLSVKDYARVISADRRYRMVR